MVTADEKKFDIVVGVKLSEQDLTDVLITAIEGGSNYWCWDVRFNAIGYPDLLATDRREGEVYNEFICRNVAEGGTLTFFEYDNVNPHTITRDKLLHGIQRVLTEYPHLLRIDSAEWPLDNLDAESADAIVQMALFNELRYG